MAVRKIIVKEKEISLFAKENSEYISITDIAKSKDSKRSDYVIQNWMRNRNTIEFIGLWESLHNETFNSIEFDGFRNQAGLNSFSLTPKKWIQSTNAIGIISKPGKYGGTFAHQDIAFEFASWISAEFKLYLLKEFQRLKEEEAKSKSLTWNLQRELAKVNYKIHTDAVKEHLIPDKITKEQAEFIYASEADLLNVALFGMTAKQWRSKNKNKNGNLRDYARIEQLVILSNLESINSVLIEQGLSQKERLLRLNETAINQMKSLMNAKTIKRLKK
ncbi:MAG: KilA-N domain-containing protein [Ignavibacterium sp.]|nr:KilA-N domain-containing protein [Melioribacteraceae bacterium]MDD3558633.1 KilA-N domain-containing protein [Melioribacteraceae bacterium]MDD5609770.1 KilA-N domain-containing protein [Ignavibacterium sp.]